MQVYLNKSIKEVINQFPAIEDILNDYDVGCAPCNVGDCLLKDIVEIHNLSEEEERTLLTRIAKAIYPDREIELPQIIKKSRQVSKKIKYSPPIKKLADEHKLIKRLIALIPRITEASVIVAEEDREIIRDLVDYIRNYADKYHHAKEENILFKNFDEKLDIIQTMLIDHDKARSYVRAVLEALDNKDAEGVKENLSAYRELLSEHIKKEDEILYPWMDRNLSTSQVGQLFSRFNEVDLAFGDTPEKYEKFVRELEERFAG
ncbi:MAG: hypothetical protein FVQ81_13905 [Candidatus Glassbacteria bacterium]|nr:hypothetical protein [Candidatus Glassbacteria bacterium]